MRTYRTVLVDRPSQHSRRKRAAFTLIELFIVEAIIAILVAILVPALNRAREKAQKDGRPANSSSGKPLSDVVNQGVPQGQLSIVQQGSLPGAGKTLLVPLIPGQPTRLPIQLDLGQQLMTDDMLRQFGAPPEPFMFGTDPDRASVGTLMLTEQADGTVHLDTTLNGFFQITDPTGEVFSNREAFVMRSSFDVLPTIPINPFGNLYGDGLDLVNSSGTVGATLEELTVNTVAPEVPEPSSAALVVLGGTCLAAFVLGRRFRTRRISRLLVADRRSNRARCGFGCLPTQDR